jgi:hypothetical protein
MPTAPLLGRRLDTASQRLDLSGGQRALLGPQVVGWTKLLLSASYKSSSSAETVTCDKDVAVLYIKALFTKFPVEPSAYSTRRKEEAGGEHLDVNFGKEVTSESLLALPKPPLVRKFRTSFPSTWK